MMRKESEETEDKHSGKRLEAMTGGRRRRGGGMGGTRKTGERGGEAR